MITPEEYTDNTPKAEIPSPDEYIGVAKSTTIPSPDQYIGKPQMETVEDPSSFKAIAKDVGRTAVGTVKELSKIGPLKYIYEDERKELEKLSSQTTEGGSNLGTRKLLLDTLETVSIVGWNRLAQAGKSVIKTFMPKTYNTLSKVATTPLTKQAAKGAVESDVIEQAAVEAVDEPTVTQKVVQAIKDAKPVRKEQEKIYTQERTKRINEAMKVEEKGEQGYYQQLSKLKGELPKVDYESIRTQVTQDDIDSLFTMITDSPAVTGFNEITAKRGLGKILGEVGGTVPQPSELKELVKVFGEEFVDTLLTKRSGWQKIKEAGGQLLNIPRSLMSSFDLSAPLRQGLFLGPSHPQRFAQSFGTMFKTFGSEKNFAALQASIEQKPTYPLMEESGLALMDLSKAMTAREEKFMSQWAEKIPLVGKGVRASSRAYTGFLNKFRADVFEDFVSKTEKLGLDPLNNPNLTQSIAKFVNAATGRGELGVLEDSAVALNALIFSPRLMSSRLTLLNPVYYVKQDPFVRKEALKSLFTLAGAVGTTLGVASAAGVKVGTDIRSADFGKMRVGNTRIDIMGGFQQYIRAAGQLATGEYVSSTTGKVITLGESYNLNQLDILYKIFESKQAPVASFITTILKGKDIEGKDVSVPKEVARRMIPMMAQDIYELAQDDPELIPLSALGAFGVGVQTYTYNPSSKKTVKPLSEY